MRNRIRLGLPAPPPGGFRCIVADCPWSFADKGSRIAPDQRKKRLGRKGYRTLGVEQILNLPVASIAAEDSLLFLWTTSAHLLDGSSPAVARAWGFEPKTTVCWVKVSRRQVIPPDRLWPRLVVGMGHYTRGAHELLIIARRGRAKVLRHDVPSVFFALRRAHSQKPREAMDLIERLCAGPRLELFARARRPGWIAWGDQIARRAA